jgi:hypothetical protein
MPPLKKTKIVDFKIVEKIELMDALKIMELTFDVNQPNNLKVAEQKKESVSLRKNYYYAYKHEWLDTIVEIWRWHNFKIKGKGSESYEDIYKFYMESIKQSEKEPVKIKKYERLLHITNETFIPLSSSRLSKLYNKTRLASGLGLQADWKETGEEWVFKRCIYKITRNYTDEQIRLLILEDFDKESRYFERLKTRFESDAQNENLFSRERIPESVRFEVWRRDGGKCAKCGSRERLEYDHIVPISKGGSNTDRNIELLCEKHNRSKSNNIV